jgi:hypothetical protein
MATGFSSNVQGAPSDAKHAKVLDLFDQWRRDHESKRAFVKRDEIATYQATLNKFIADAEAVRASIKRQTLGSVRFGSSISAVDALIEHAKRKREFFDQEYVDLGRRSGTFGKKMTFDEQRMVPQTKDFGDITAKIKQLKTQDLAMTELTPSQAWALVAANTRGELNEFANYERAARRLREFNEKWHTSYGVPDLALTFEYMVEKTRIATQYRMEQVPGQQQGITAGGTPLYRLLMQSGFKNVWETGTSQASNERDKRGAVEEQMGYGAALRRTAGRAQDYGDATSTFDPRDRQGQSTASEMPRYAATIGDAQQAGVAKRYGSSYIVWKESVRQRVTWTPGDSWSLGAEGPQSVKNYVSLEHPEVIFVHADENLLRIFMAEATGKDSDFLKRARANPDEIAKGGAYIETQIHGDLTWSDVAEVVLDPNLTNLASIRADFEAFKRSKGLTFKVRTTTGT